MNRPMQRLAQQFALLGLLCACTLAGAAPRHALTLYDEPPKYPANFEHFEYANPDAPKGGVLRQAGFGSFDSLNPFINKGVSAEDIGLIYDTLTTNSLDEPFTVYGLLAEKIERGPKNDWVRFYLRPRHASRWPAGHRRGRRLYLRDPGQPGRTAIPGLLCGRRQGRGRRQAPGSLRLQTCRQPRAANDPRPAAGAAQALVGRARLHFRQPGAATRQRPLSRRASPARPLDQLCARGGLLGSRPRREPWLLQLRPAGIRLLPRQHRRAPGIQGRTVRLLAGNQRKELGNRLRHSRRARRPPDQGRNSELQPHRHAGLHLQHPPSAAAGPAGPRSAGIAVRLRMDQPASCSTALLPYPQLFRQLGARLLRPARQG